MIANDRDGDVMNSNADQHCGPRVSSFISLHARRRPEHVAVIRNGMPVTYARLDQDLRRMTAALAGFGLAPHSLAAISHDDLYIHLLIMLGFDNLGVTTGSFRAEEGAECHALLAASDLIIAPGQVPPPAAGRRFTITADWLQTVLATPAPRRPPYPPPAPGDVVAIFRSSGTTGQPKRMAITRANLNARLRLQRDPTQGLGVNSRSRFLATMHFSVGSTVMGAHNCLCLGATFMFATGRRAADIIAEYRPTHFTMMPFQLRLLLNDLAENFPLLPELTVQTVGAKMPADLRRGTLARLAGRARDTYGTNEVGVVGAVDEAGIVTLAAGIEVAIAGAEGTALAIGEIGAVRIRGATVVDGYVGDAAATAEMFRDGWFYPGDLGMMVAPQQLKLVGRRADVLNMGGTKVACADIESKLLAVPAILDVAVFQQNDGGASSPVQVCAVVGNPTDPRALEKSIGPIIGFPFRLCVVGSIPRTAEGKIRRNVLRQAVLSRSPASAAPQAATAKAVVTA